MFSLQKPMPRGRYALLAAAHALLLGGLLRAMVWGEFNYLPPVSMLAYLAGIGALASLVAITIRRMRDAGMHSYLLLCPLGWSLALALVCLTLFWEAFATPISAELAHPYTPAALATLYIAGILFAPLAATMLCAPSQKNRREPKSSAMRYFRHIANALAHTFRFGGRASRSEFWSFAPPALAAVIALAYLASVLLWDASGHNPFYIFAEPATAAIAALALALLLPLPSITIRRVRDAGHLRHWLAALLILVLGALLCIWAIVPAAYFPNESPLAAFYVFFAYPLYAAAFPLYSLYILVTPGEK